MATLGEQREGVDLRRGLKARPGPRFEIDSMKRIQFRRMKQSREPDR